MANQDFDLNYTNLKSNYLKKNECNKLTSKGNIFIEIFDAKALHAIYPNVVKRLGL